MRTIKSRVKGFATVDGAGVNLIRVFGNNDVKTFDPLLMLDSFDSENYDDYKNGFPMHPHRGIETITYLAQGGITHRDNLGNENKLTNGGVQWMSSGSGILHEEILEKSDRMLGVQLWLNIPAKYKMTPPTYQDIKSEDIPNVDVDGGYVRVISGELNGVKGPGKSDFTDLTFYSIVLKSGSKIEIHSKSDENVTLFTLLGAVIVSGSRVEEKTAVHLSEGETTVIEAIDDIELLYLAARRLDEPIAWGGPVVMNTQEELQNAFIEMRNGTFIK